MKTSSILLNALFSLFSVAFAFGQNNVTGVVVDEQGEPIYMASITAANTSTSCLTNENGQFQMSITTVPTCHLVVRALGYENQELDVKLKTGKEVRLTITMIADRIQPIPEVVIVHPRATENTPTTFTNVSTKTISKLNFGQDLPYLLESTPSAVVTSDAGTGIGYTGIRIRGVDPTRTNVTINGIPINDAESHAVYWVNMPDFASSAGNIQVQRGVGTSTNGAAAFGASINIQSENESKSYAETDNSLGSFMTLRNTIKAGTGMINNRFWMNARLSQISSDGYIDRASANLRSYYLSATCTLFKGFLRANVFSGKEVTYQSWWGIPEAKLSGDSAALLTHFYNNYYPGGMYETAEDSVNLFNSDPRKYNYYTYKNEEDNYKQDHYQLHYDRGVGRLKQAHLSISGHYTRGQGYYEQYKRNQDFAVYGFNPIISGSDTVSTTDLIRRRWLDNHFYGMVFTLNYNKIKYLKLTFGGSANQYLGGHFGEVIWARQASQSEIGQRYYDNKAVKSEFSAYARAYYEIGKFNKYYGDLRINLFADLQVRGVNYNYNGVDQYFSNLIPMKVDVNFLFFNPKVGASIKVFDRSTFYVSYAMGHREPVRDDFIQSSVNSRPKPEELSNIELGYRYRWDKLFVNANSYYMLYKNQLILTGEINDVGAYSRVNVPNSYRIGLELDGGYMLLKNLSVTANLTLSQNKIKEFNEYVDNYDNYDANGNMIQDVIAHKNTDIAFSPNIIAAAGLSYEPIKGLDITLTFKHVGKQYLDNTSSDNRKMDAYSTTNAMMSYTLAKWGLREIKLAAQVNNIFNIRYSNNGYTWGYIAGGTRIIENFYFPQAGTNFMLRLSLKI
jgi:iron complex outermembrane receptor protein